MLPEILTKVLDFWHPWMATLHFWGAEGLQALEGKPDGGRRREGRREVRVHAQARPHRTRWNHCHWCSTLDSLALAPRCMAVPGLVWKSTDGRTGCPRCPWQSNRGDRRDSQQGAPRLCAKPASPFPALLRLPSKATDLPPSVAVLKGSSAASQLQARGRIGPPLLPPQAPPLPLGLCRSFSSLQNGSCTWPGCVQHVCFPLHSSALAVLLSLSSRTAIRRGSTGGAKALREGMRRRTASHHQHFLAFHEGGG